MNVVPEYFQGGNINNWSLGGGKKGKVGEKKRRLNLKPRLSTSGPPIPCKGKRRKESRIFQLGELKEKKEMGGGGLTKVVGGTMGPLVCHAGAIEMAFH